MIEKRIILLVDDSENDILLVRTAFKKAEFDTTLQAVHNGIEAIAYLTGEGQYQDRNKYPLPTLMLLDLNMPMKNGFEVLGWLRTHPVLKRLTTIVLSASARSEDVERAFDLCANAFLVKPSSLEELTAMVRTLCDWLEITYFPALSEVVKR